MNLPEEFTRSMAALLGEEYPLFNSSLTQSPPVSIRLNPGKTYPLDDTYEKVPWCDTGYYLPGRLPFTFDPLFHTGVYYVQEASSMFVGYILRQLIKEPVILLDLCAAPGGKTTLALSSLPQGSFVISNEYVPQRAVILAENVIKWGNPYCAVTNASPADYGKLEEAFDVLMIDAPCSGEGMFRKDPASITEWSPRNIKNCVQRQRTIINDVWNSLRPGGIAIYSTCTYNTDENEDMAEYLCRELGCKPVSVSYPQEWGITRQLKGDIPFYRFLPHKTRGEGFSATVVRKPDESRTTVRKGVRVGKNADIKIPAEVKSMMRTPEAYKFGTYAGGAIYALPKEITLPSHFPGNIKLLHAGITVAEPKGKDWIPHHSLLSTFEYRCDAFPDIPLTIDEARAYLRREALPRTATGRGHATVSYAGVPIGWVKQVGVRSNNLYPQEWRIRSSHTPEDDNVLSVKTRAI